MNDGTGNSFGPADEVSRLRDRVAQLEQLEQEREILSRLTVRVAAAASVAELMDALCEESDRLLHWDCCYLAHRSPEQAGMRIVCFIDTEDGRRRSFPGEDLTPDRTGPVLRRALGGETILVNRDCGEPVPAMVPFGTNRPSASLMFAPVRCGETISGVLSVQSYTHARYAQADLRCLQRIAEAIAPALERVHAEDELRQSEAKHRALVEQIPAITYTAAINAASTTTYVSPQVATILGYTPAEYMADPDIWRKHLHPDDRERVMAEVDRCHATGVIFLCEYRAVARNGRVVWFRDEAELIRDEAGRPLCLQGVMFDITEQKRAEDLLRLQRDLAVALSSATTLSEAMRQVLDTVVSVEGIECAGIQLADEATGGFRHVAHTGVSAAFAEAVAYVAADSPQARRIAAGRPIYSALDQLPGPHPVGDAEGFKGVGVLPVLYEGRVIGALNVASRTRREVPSAARAALEAIAAQIGAVIERIRARNALERARDELESRVEQRTAELRAANEALRKSEALVRTISDNLASGMIYQIVRRSDGSRKFTYLSDGVRRFYGVTPEEAMADAGLIYGRVHEEDRLRVWQEEEEANRTLSVFRTEVRMIDPSGGVRWSSFTSTPRRLDDGTTCWDGIESDITDRKQAEEALRLASGRLERIARMTGAVLGSQSLHEAGQRLAAQIRQCFGADACVIRLLEGEELVLLGAEGIPTGQMAQRLPVVGIGRELLTTRRPLVIADVRTDPLTREMAARHVPGGYVFTSYAGVPLLAGETAVGVLGLYAGGTPRVFTALEVEQLQIVGNHVGIILSNERLFETIRAQQRELEREIRERTRAEKTLSESEARFRLYTESSMAGICIFQDGALKYANPALAKMLGYTQEELARLEAIQLVCAEDRPRVAEAIRQRLDGEVEVARYECGLIRKSGRPIQIEAMGRRILYEGRAAILSTVHDITDRKRVEEALRESEAKYRALVEATDTGFVIVDAEGRVLDANAEYVRLTGHKALQEIRGRSALEWTAEDDVARNAEAVRECVSRGFVRNLEIEYVNAQGARVPLEINATVVRTAEGNRIVGLCRDITDRKRAEDALRKSEARLQEQLSELEQIYRHSPVGLCVIDRNLRYVRISERLAEINGRSVEEHLRSTVPEILPGLGKRLQEMWRPVFEKGEAILDVEVEGETPREPGVARYWLASFLPLRSAAGDVRAMLSSVVEITERKRAQEALRESEAKYRAVVQNQTEFISRHRSGGILTFVNNALCRFVGLGPDDLIGRSFFDFLSAEDAAAERVHLDSLTPAHPMASIEHRILLPNGETRWLQWTNQALFDPLGRLLEYQSTGRDVTDRKRAEEALRAAEQRLREAQKLEAIGRFGRGVAHEFNNLMATVMGLASHMRANRRLNVADRDRLVHIEEAARAAADLAHELLAFARGGKIRPHLLPFADVLRSALVLVPPMLRPDVAVEQHIAPDLWRVHCDQTQVQHVIVNLCRNAIDAMPNGGRLTIRAENRTLATALDDAHPSVAPGEYVCLSVEDTGHGMDARTMKRIFDPFFTTKDCGHGLGLAAAYGIMAAHGGGISVTSEPGKGSTFRMWLPREENGVDRGTLRPE